MIWFTQAILTHTLYMLWFLKHVTAFIAIWSNLHAAGLHISCRSCQRTRWKQITEMLLIHSGQRILSLSGCEHIGGVLHDRGLEQCIIHWEMDSSPISVSVPLLQWNPFYITASVIHTLISPDIVKNQVIVNNPSWQLDWIFVKCEETE